MLVIEMEEIPKMLRRLADQLDGRVANDVAIVGLGLTLASLGLGLLLRASTVDDQTLVTLLASMRNLDSGGDA